MVLAMILAHLVGDFILQTDGIAYWKSKECRGVLAHGAIILVVTALFALPFRPYWWQGVLVISITHTLIDGLQFYFPPPISPLLRLFLDQFMHFLTIFIALAFGGYLEAGQVAGASQLTQSQLVMVYAVGYAFLTMPAWILMKFVAYWLVRRSGPVFPDTFNKYLGIAERVIILTLVLTGQFLLIPFLAIPRLVLERRSLADDEKRPIYMLETIGGIALAVGVGLLLRLVV